jgi:hypothetical protein
VLRTVVIAAAVAAALGAPAHAQLRQEIELMPRVGYTREVDFTPHGPVVVHVVVAPRPAGLYSLRPLLARNAVLARDRVTTMQKALSAEGTSVAVNANLAAWTDALVRGGVMDAAPVPTRTTVGIASDGALRAERLIFSGTWRGSGQRRPLALNQPPAGNTTTLYTRAWGPTTPPGEAAVQAVLAPFPATVPNADLVGNVVDLHQGASTPIPANGAVLVGRDAQAGKLVAEAPLGSRVVVRLDLAPEWRDVPNAIGGGPVLVRAGRPVFGSGEAFPLAELALRRPRTAIGQLADGRVLLVVADGRAGYSAGMTNFELALTMVRLGAVTAAALDGGAAATLAFDGRVLNRPTAPGGEAAVAEALILSYSGVYAPPPGRDVVSPNGDGTGDVQTLSYRLVRPASVTVGLVGPDGSSWLLDSGFRPAGLYPLTWEPTSAAEGRWTSRVTATDDLGRSSSAERTFAVNNTLGFLTVAPAELPPRGRSSIAFVLARPARVAVTVETRTGGVIRTIADRSFRAGRHTLAWNGVDGGGRAAVTGSYVVRVAARNALGTADLQRPLSVRRR